MTRRVACCLVVLCGCAEGFEGDQRTLVFDSNLSRRGATWTPETPVARGSTVSFFVVPRFCVAQCPRTSVTAEVEGGALRLLQSRENGVAVEARAAGSDVVRWSGTARGTFHVEVREPAGLGVTDPLLLALAHTPEGLLQVVQGGAWPDVTGALVLGAGGALYVETAVFDDGGRPLGFDARQLSVEGGADGGWEVLQTGSLLDVRAPDAGATAFRLRWEDGGVARDVSARVAGPEEAATVDFHVAQSVASRMWAIKAVVTTDGGERFSEPPVTWALDDGFVDLQRQGASFLPDLRPARDVRLLEYRPPGPGTFHPTVTATVGAASKTLTFEVFEPEPADAGVAERPAPAPTGCGCGAGGAALTPWLLLLAAVLRRRRRGFCARAAPPRGNDAPGAGRRHRASNPV